MSNSQETFFNAILGVKKLNNTKESIYKELIYNRYEDTILDAFDKYATYIGDDLIEKQIVDFIKYGSKNYYIWLMAKEFMNYISTTKIKNDKKAMQLLSFGWEQIKILSLERVVKKSKFSWSKNFKLSKNSSIMSLVFSPFEEIENRTNTNILIYKDSKDYRVYHIKITKFLYKFLNLLKLNRPTKSLKLTSLYFSQNPKHIKYILEPTLNKFAYNGIIVTTN